LVKLCFTRVVSICGRFQLFQFVLLSLVFLSHYPYLNFKIFSLKIIEKKEEERSSLSCPALPSAPAAWAAASGPTSGHSPGVGPPPGRLLASSHGVATPPSARLTPLVVGSALVRRKLAGQPQRGRYRLWRLRRGRLCGLCCR
jgi:hypothetical protein